MSSNATLVVVQQPPIITTHPVSVVTYRFGPASFYGSGSWFAAVVIPMAVQRHESARCYQYDSHLWPCRPR